MSSIKCIIRIMRNDAVNYCKNILDYFTLPDPIPWPEIIVIISGIFYIIWIIGVGIFMSNNYPATPFNFCLFLSLLFLPAIIFAIGYWIYSAVKRCNMKETFDNAEY